MSVYATYTGPAPIVRAAQLSEETADAICRWTNGYRLGPDRWVASEGCWRVSALRWYPFMTGSPSSHRYHTAVIGILTRKGEEIACEGDWIVQGVGGAFTIVHPDNFGDLYTAADHKATITGEPSP